MVRKFDVYITPFQQNRTIHLYLPDDYDYSDEHYPVVYMYDGHNLFFNEDATYGKSWGLKEFLDHYDKKFIVVGMECSHIGDERMSEYCPYHLSKSWFGPIEGKGKIYMEWVVNELKPYIDTHYRTIPFRECTMIAGSSMGGLMSYYTILAHNDLFSKAACISPSVGMCQYQIKDEIVKAQLNPDTKIFINWGTGEYPQYYRRINGELSTMLQRSNVQTRLEEFEGGHNEASWEKTIPNFMDYLWK